MTDDIKSETAPLRPLSAELPHFQVNELIKDDAVWKGCRWEVSDRLSIAWKAICRTKDDAQEVANALEAYARAARDETLPVGRQLEVTTTTGMMVSLERWNELQDELLTWRTRTLAALQTIYGLSGQYEDLNEIQAIIDRGEHHLLRPGIPIAISEEDKDWLVPMAHAQKKTLGKFVREKWAETQAVLKLTALPVGESPAAAPQVADEFCLRCGQHFECAKEKWAHDCPVIEYATAPRDTEQREIVTPANRHDCRCGERGADGTGEHYQIVADVETRRGTRVPVCVNHIGNYAAYPDNYRIFLTASAVEESTTPQATCPECGAKSQLTLTATGPWIYVTCGACKQWWSIGEIEHTPYFFGGELASNGPRKVTTCSVEGCTNPSRWQSKCEFHLNEANSAANPGSTVAAPQNRERPWIKCSTTMPANNEVVETKVDEGAGVRNEQTLKRQGNLWFFPDGSMYVYYRPTHWRPVNGPRATV